MMKNSLSISCPADLLKHKMNVLKIKSIEKLPDSGVGNCHLNKPELADVVKNALTFFESDRYELHSWCIMPTHVHVLMKLNSDFKLSEIVHSWKSFTSNEINRRIKATGSFWHREYYDTFIRNEKHYNAVMDYIAMNPVKAGLVRIPDEWRWSSAYREK